MIATKPVFAAAPEIVPIFATPLVVYDVPGAATLNDDLRRVIEAREKTHPTTQHSNMGGYQSSWAMDKWGGAPAIKLLAIGRNLANRVTADRKGNPGTGPHPGLPTGEDHLEPTWIQAAGDGFIAAGLQALARNTAEFCGETADNWQQIFVPAGFAHGFVTLEPNTEVLYKVTNFYSPEHERGIRWNDPALGIDWKLEPASAVLSVRDLEHPFLASAVDLF